MSSAFSLALALAATSPLPTEAAGSTLAPASTAPVATAPCAAETDLDFICGIHHPEDLVVLPGGRWVLASETSFGDGHVGRGALVLIDSRRGGPPPRIHRVAEVPQSATAHAPYRDCPGPPAMLSPHGIALRADASRTPTLYVVNHHREAIEVFAVRMAAGPPRLAWIGCVVMPRPVYLNSVAPTPNGGFMATKMYDVDGPAAWAKARAGQITGAVYHWRPRSGPPRLIPGSEGSVNNGIAVDRDGTIFVGLSGTRALMRLKPHQNGYQRDEVPMGFSPDNLRWAPDGNLLVAGQRYDRMTPGCTGRSCVIPWAVARFDPLRSKAVIVFESTGQNYSGATTALPLGDEIWLGSFVEDKVGRLRVRAMTDAASIGR